MTKRAHRTKEIEDVVQHCSHCDRSKSFVEKDPEGAWLISLCVAPTETICSLCLRKGIRLGDSDIKI